MAQLAVLDNTAALKYKEMINVEMWLGVLLSVNLLVTAFKHYWDEKTGGGLSSLEYSVVSELQIEKQNRYIQTELYEQTADLKKLIYFAIDKNNKELMVLLDPVIEKAIIKVLKEQKENED